ncbi:hypothetical protein BT93_E1427 [Corymbia citriodora subsp. variegata]|nr:hypothetical protein BT93_E1427 [Corymbia citriodora subsp. variegata]
MKPWILCLAIAGKVAIRHTEAATSISIGVLNPCRGLNSLPGCRAHPDIPHASANHYDHGCTKINRCRVFEDRN